MSINKQNNILFHLLTVKGISHKTALLFLSKLGFHQKTLFSSLNPTELDSYRFLLSYVKNLKHSDGVFNKVDHLLKLSNNKHLEALIFSHSRRGLRLSLGYPSNGQRTRSNARTSKFLKYSKHKNTTR